jgi:predicted nucleotidyltransferase
MEEGNFNKKEKFDFVKNENFTSFLAKGEIFKTNLPDEVKNNPELIKESMERKELLESLENIFFKIPTLTNIEDALDQNLITIEEIEKFYISIVELIEKDKNSQRLLLYFPFELLPNEKYEKLIFFKNFYKSNWKELLNEIDLRENFNTGDVLEQNLRNSPLAGVSKAAHLIPFLIEKNILSTTELLDLLKKEKSSITTDGMLDTLRILTEKGYLKEEELKKIEDSNDVNIKNTIKLIRYDLKEERLEKNDIITEKNIESLGEVFNLMNVEINNIKSNILNKEQLTQERTNWLTNTEKERIINRYSEMIYQNFSNSGEIENVLKNEDLKEENLISIIKAIEKNIINSNQKDDYINLLNKLKSEQNNVIKDQIFNTLNRLKSINMDGGILNETEINKIKNDKEKEIELKMVNILSEIKNNNILSKNVYPITLLYGSHVKGYDKETSDLDIGVFMKENSDLTNQTEIEESFKHILNKLNINGSVIEFLLKKENDSIFITNYENLAENLEASTITSPLTGTWYGDKKSIETLQKQLIPEYLYSENKKIKNVDARKIWLKDLERNLIQYRLMHKGYIERNIEQGGINSIYKDEIDGESMFYDSGFRRLATKIYLEKIFLPQLKK